LNDDLSLKRMREIDGRLAINDLYERLPLGSPLQQKARVVLRFALSYTSGQRG
jgi:hypothetical protein